MRWRRALILCQLYLVASTAQARRVGGTFQSQHLTPLFHLKISFSQANQLAWHRVLFKGLAIPDPFRTSTPTGEETSPPSSRPALLPTLYQLTDPLVYSPGVEYKEALEKAAWLEPTNSTRAVIITVANKFSMAHQVQNWSSCRSMH